MVISFAALTERPFMPGTFTTVYLVAFDLDDHGHPVQAFPPKVEADEGTAVTDAKDLARHHAGVVVWKREGDPVVGEEGVPDVVFSAGKIGDFN